EHEASGTDKIKMAVPLLRRQRPPHPATFCARVEGARGQRQAARRAGEPACAAPRVCQPSPAQRRGPPHRADAARPRRHFNDADLYARTGEEAENPGARFAPAGGDVAAGLLQFIGAQSVSVILRWARSGPRRLHVPAVAAAGPSLFEALSTLGRLRVTEKGPGAQLLRCLARLSFN